MLYEQLLAIQKEIEPITKSDTNPFFKSRYFDINTLLAALKPVLSKHGLVLTQGLGQTSDFEGNARPALITSIRTEKEKEDYTLPLPEIADAQKFGAMVTYYRRYAIQSLFALEAEDDDGNTASGKVAQLVARPVAVKPTGMSVKNNTLYNTAPKQIITPPVKPVTIHDDEPPY